MPSPPKGGRRTPGRGDEDSLLPNGPWAAWPGQKCPPACALTPSGTPSGAPWVCAALGAL